MKHHRYFLAPVLAGGRYKKPAYETPEGGLAEFALEPRVYVAAATETQALVVFRPHRRATPQGWEEITRAEARAMYEQWTGHQPPEKVV